MAISSESRGARVWSNGVLIVVGVVLFAVGAWPDPLAINPPARATGGSWTVYVLAAVLTLLALLAAVPFIGPMPRGTAYTRADR